MSEPWTRNEQINYSVFGTRDAPPEWDEAWRVIGNLARVTGHTPGTSIFAHLNKLLESWHHASMSVD